MSERPTVSTIVKAAVPTSATELTDVLVVGGGQMGSGIAQVCAAAGRRVWVSDSNPAMLERSRQTIASSAARLHEKNRIDDEQAESINRIEYVHGLDDIPHAQIDLVIEAIVEDQRAKQELLSRLDSLVPPRTILASNTSSISITSLASVTHRPAHVVGLHFMNPVPVLELVEIIPGLETAPVVVDLVEEFAHQLGKTPVRSADAPGFITNRVLMPMINEALFCLHEGVGTAEGIDEAMRLGMKHPLGPLALADLIGLDTCLSILEVLHRDLGDDKYRPCPMLRTYVAAGRLGRKSGAGIYRYDG